MGTRRKPTEEELKQIPTRYNGSIPPKEGKEITLQQNGSVEVATATVTDLNTIGTQLVSTSLTRADNSPDFKLDSKQIADLETLRSRADDRLEKELLKDLKTEESLRNFATSDEFTRLEALISEFNKLEEEADKKADQVVISALEAMKDEDYTLQTIAENLHQAWKAKYGSEELDEFDISTPCLISPSNRDNVFTIDRSISSTIPKGTKVTTIFKEHILDKSLKLPANNETMENAISGTKYQINTKVYEIASVDKQGNKTTSYIEERI